MRLNPAIDEIRWIEQTRHLLDVEFDEEEDCIPVSILKVPKTLVATKSEAYTPQLVALGPYHRFHPELVEMERYKLLAARRIQKRLRVLKFQQVVDNFMKFELRIHAHYHRYLDFNSETLAWMMAVDASFLLEFLKIYAADADGKSLRRMPSRVAHLMDYEGRSSAHNMILRDVLMVENQIPLFLLRKIMDAQCSSTQEADDMLSKMLAGFIKEVYPFKRTENFLCIDASQHPHVLDVLYNMVVPKSELRVNVESEDQTGPVDSSGGNRRSTKRAMDRIQALSLRLMEAILNCVRHAIFSICVKAITNLPVFIILKQPFEHLLFSDQVENSRSQQTNPSHPTGRPLMMDEIAIPSAKELVDAGVRFSPVDGEISKIEFDTNTGVFQLPTISLDVNTEVVLRNLVAYEVSVVTGPWIVTRYTEIMNGIIDAGDDVRLLRESGVVLNHMKSDEEVADVWNGMSKSIRLTRVPSLDRVVEDVNKYYNSRWRVRVWRFMRRNGFDPFQLPTFLFAALLLFLLSLHVLCLFHKCAR